MRKVGISVFILITGFVLTVGLLYHSKQDDSSMPVDVADSLENQGQAEDERFSVVIYEITHAEDDFTLIDDVFLMPRSKIPYYKNGELVYISETDFNNYRYDAGPLLGLDNAINCVTANCLNLIGNEVVAEQLRRHSNLITDTENEISVAGASVEITSRGENSATARLAVEGLGEYSIVMEAPRALDTLFVRNITFYPDYGELNMDGPILLLAVSDDIFDLPIDNIPYYSEGNIRIYTEDYFIYRQGGHSSWKSSSLDAADVLCSNLLGDDRRTAEGAQRTDVYGDEVRTTIDDEQYHILVGIETNYGVYIEITSPFDEKTGKESVKMEVDGVGRYDITFKQVLNDLMYLCRLEFTPE